MFPYGVLRFWPREQLIRKFFAASLLLLMLFSIFLFEILISENERFSKEIEGNRETKQEPYIGTKAKPRSLHQSDIPQEDSDIFYVDSEPKNVVADDQLQIVTSHPVKKLPNVLIIGVKKSGTKVLVEFLKIHPDVSAPANEIHYFSRNFHKGLDWYRRQMPVSIGNQIVIERTRGYFVHKDAPLRISLQIPNARLIVVVRNPVLRSLLDYTSQCVRNKSKVSFLENFFWNNITGFIDMSRDFVQTSMYVKFMENWLSYFKLEQFHFVNGDMLYKNPSLELSKLETFLNLRNMISSDHFFYNTSIDALCIKKYECQGRSRCFTENKLKYRPPSYLVRRLRDFFHPFNEKFYKQTKQHFSWNI